jgi:Tfp pilus assembly protein PilF
VLRTGGLRMETAALLMSGQEGGTIPFAILTLPLEPQGDRVRVAVLVEVDGSALLDEHGEGPLRVDVSVYALGEGGSVQGSIANTIEADAERLGDELEKSGYQFLGELSLPPGKWSLRTLVKNPQSANVGLRITEVAVPDLKQAERFLLPPLFYVANPESWLPVQAVETRGRPSAVQALGREELPGARAILQLDHEMETIIPAFNLGEATELRMEVRTLTGELTADLPVRITGRQATAVPGLELVAAAFTPTNLVPGGYLLRAKVGGEAEGRPPGTAVIVVEGDVQGRVWAEFTRSKRQEAMAAAGGGTGGGAGAGQRPRLAPQPRRRKTIDPKPVQAAYLEALRALTAGDGRGARAAVAKLEEKYLMEDGGEPEDLAKAELDAISGIAQSDPTGLLPLMVLHLDLYRAAWRDGALLRSTHSRMQFTRITDLYASRDKSEAGRATASRFLLNLANDLGVTSVQGIRRRVLEKALDLDPENALILLCLAVDSERDGDPHAALGYLERIKRLRPEDGEVTVRMALNQQRLGKKAEARRLLEQVMAGQAGTDPWWHSLAYQEAARMALMAGEAKKAEQTLRAGIQRWPQDDKLRIQLAGLLDQLRQPKEAQALLAGMQAVGATGAASPRRRYTELPFDQLDFDAAELRRQAEERLPVLAAAIGGKTAQKGAS